MIGRNTFATIFGLITVLAIGGCASVPAQPEQQSGPNAWRANYGEAEIFFYAVYDNPADEPSFPETFRFRIDGGFIGEIDKDGLVETKVSPGYYLFTVDEVDWGGNTVTWGGNTITHPTPTTLNKQVKAGDVLFIAAHFPAGQKPFLANTNEEQGIKDTGLRKRINNCEGLSSLCRALF